MQISAKRLVLLGTVFVYIPAKIEEVELSRVVKIRKDIPVESVRRTIKNTTDGTFRLRLMIIEKLLSEPTLSLQAVAKALIVNRETVTKCLQLFNKGGLDLLKPKKAGRKEGNPKYESEIFEDLVKKLEKNNSWSVYQMQAYLETKHHITIPESTIYYRISKLGFSSRAQKAQSKPLKIA